ncbi:MAG: division/cell wall cluster transcriptional repressor MraZ [Ruminococcaceae bacterium]|nr:division/cell wall cluster transcriptional repressor MraZ [Oscillospiraceae bacterium]MBQ3214942.1 division/cell wall cluster transcriptional repressor MraZ [Oscillospiraceae bacterium]
MIGKYPAKLDDKNRLFVPAKLRSELGEAFFVTLGVNCGRRCLTVYTDADWQTLQENYNALPISQRGAATSLIFINATECTPDKQFRFMLTQNLLDFAGIGRDVVIVGRAGQAEIWSADEFAAFEAENLTPEKLLASLEAIGL